MRPVRPASIRRPPRRTTAPTTPTPVRRAATAGRRRRGHGRRPARRPSSGRTPRRAKRVTTSHCLRSSVGRSSSKPSNPSWSSTAPARAAKRRASSSPASAGTVMALILITVRLSPVVMAPHQESRLGPILPGPARSSPPPRGSPAPHRSAGRSYLGGNAWAIRTLMSCSTRRSGSGASTGNWSAPFDVL